VLLLSWMMGLRLLPWLVLCQLKVVYFATINMIARFLAVLLLATLPIVVGMIMEMVQEYAIKMIIVTTQANF